MDNDTSWCPVCDRAIQPKRYQVPVQPTTTTTIPTPPPPSPVRRTKSGARQRGGLVQGTGRVKPNGALKETKPQPVRLRTVIDQGPTPLYCSDECHLVDLNRGLPHNFNPDRYSDSSFTSLSSATSSSDSCVSQSTAPTTQSATSTPPSKSLAALARAFNWGDFPPPAPVMDDEPPMRTVSTGDFNNGIIMAGRRLNELLPKPTKRNALGHFTSQPEPRTTIPGWNDGTHAWRASMYNLAAPDASPVAHKSFATRGSRGVQSTFSAPRHQEHSSSSAALSAEDARLMKKYEQSFRRQSTPTTSAAASPVSPASASYPPSKRERPLLERGAEGKLLVPQVMRRVNSAASSSASLSSQYSAPGRFASARSPLSQGSESSEEDSDDNTHTLRRPKRPTVETRSWSYDNIKTYPTMQLPRRTRMEKRTERRVVEGEEVEVEVEVEVEEKPKRLFIFASSMPPAVCA
ncbi:hypothetical protein DXG01_011958 [Tephrocybe rancida]|nr:hypothetical protein DXG01_011958 [Tephrocybe rancida]